MAGALVALASVLLTGAAAQAEDAPRQVDHALSATRGEAARIVDDLGRTVLLRGVNVNGLGDYYQEHADLPSTLPLTRDDLHQIAAHGSDGFDHVGFFEPAVVFGPLPTPVPLPVGFTDDPNLVYAPHLYNESISILPGSIEEGFANAATAAGAYGTTFFSGEWGWFGDDAADQPKIERYAAAEDAHLVGGTWWQWEQACGDPHAVPDRHVRPPCAGTSPHSDGLVTRDAANVAVLERAYPRAAPGRLTGVQANVRSGALVVTGVADRAGVAADLWVPGRCDAPVVAGTNVGPATTRSVPGGSRLEVPVPAAGDYRIEVTCAVPGSTATSPPPGPGTRGRLPATGGAAAVGPAAGLLLLAVLLRRVSRTAR